MFDTLTLALILIPCLIVAIVFHEVAHGWTALALGDTTARDMGRLTLNPIKHVDPVGTLLVPGALALFGGPIFGWAKPVPVNARRLDNPRYGMMAVAAAGPGTNFVLAAIGAVILGLALPQPWNVWQGGPVGMMVIENGLGATQVIATGMMYFIAINIFLGLFNLLPIPPFDGSHIVGGLLPGRWALSWQKLQAMGMLLLFVLIAATWAFPDAQWIANLIYPPVEWLLDKYFAVAEYISRAIA
ncbi:site-2 protease family protein [Qipengyuania xiapuensis]|uniref:Site-2 protease family protein n=1 Tax=Qipengyuania xiapuensis TaxID=2867236 RepID=A0ABX9A0K3_9SPHN|nr:site-2 protease family protein [Qipengyuania xiapuensis]QZD93418.1 site-2 protease family protein [Qipengyuania xiapuensis]